MYEKLNCQAKSIYFNCFQLSILLLEEPVFDFEQEFSPNEWCFGVETVVEHMNVRQWLGVARDWWAASEQTLATLEGGCEETLSDAQVSMCPRRI